METRRARRIESGGPRPRRALHPAGRRHWRLLTDLANFGGPADVARDRDIGVYGADRTPSGLAFRGPPWLDPWQRQLWDWYWRVQPGTVSNWGPVPRMWPVAWEVFSPVRARPQNHPSTSFRRAHAAVVRHG